MSNISACSVCSGSGIIHCSISTFGSTKPVEQIDINCIDCRGRGTITSDIVKMIEKRNTIWCDCPDTSLDRGFYYVSDGVSTVCAKHHWCCSTCKKIIQVG